MIKAQIITCCRCAGLPAIAGLALCLHTQLAVAQALMDGQTSESEAVDGQTHHPIRKALPDQLRRIFLVRDGLQIELLDLPTKQVSIGPDGTLYLPRRALYVEGLTVEERAPFTQQFSNYVRDPQVYVRPVVYSPFVFMSGVVKRPGLHLSGNTNLSRLSESAESQVAG